MSKWEVASLLFAPSSQECSIVMADGSIRKGILRGILREAGDGRNFIISLLVGSTIEKLYLRTVD